MDLEIKSITTSLSSLSLNENKIIKIQKWFRGCILTTPVTFNYV